MADSANTDAHSAYNERFTCTFPYSVIVRLRKIAELEDRSVAWVVRRAVDEWLSQYPWPVEQQRLFDDYEDTS